MVHDSSSRPARLRPVLGYVAVVGMLPYLFLKLFWIAGVEIGVPQAGLMTAPVMRMANAFTAALEIAAIVVVLALTHRWGLRVPAWLILLPMWVGSGLLAPIVVSFPAIAADLATAPAGSGLAPWVVPLVYSSFAWQGIALLTAFTLYARVRWASAFGGSSPTRGPGPIAVTGAVLALVVAVAEFVTAFDDRLRLANTVLAVVEATAALAAVVGVVVLGARGRTWLTTVLLWTGSATLFATGFWSAFGWVAMAGTAGMTDWLLVAVGCLGGLLLAYTLLSGPTTAPGSPEDAGPVAQRQVLTPPAP